MTVYIDLSLCRQGVPGYLLASPPRASQIGGNPMPSSDYTRRGGQCLIRVHCQLEIKVHSLVSEYLAQ